VESSTHLFLHCLATSQLREWLSKGSVQLLDLSNSHNLLVNIVGAGSKFVHQIMTFAFIHTIWCIWLERNNRCYNNKLTSVGSMINKIISWVRLSFKLVLSNGPAAMSDLKISHLFGIPLKNKRVRQVQVHCWIPHGEKCFKVICDGSAFGNPSSGLVALVFKNSIAEFLGALTHNIGYATHNIGYWLRVKTISVDTI